MLSISNCTWKNCVLFDMPGDILTHNLNLISTGAAAVRKRSNVLKTHVSPLRATSLRIPSPRLLFPDNITLCLHPPNKIKANGNYCGIACRTERTKIRTRRFHDRHLPRRIREPINFSNPPRVISPRKKMECD